MHALCSQPPSPVYSAGELCRAIAAGTAFHQPFVTPGLDRILRHESEHNVLEVQSGVRWADLAPMIGASFLPGSVGDCVAANRAGPDGRPIVAHVQAFTLASADGGLRRASRERSAELFGLAVGGFGAFGPFYSLTLDLASLARAVAARAAAVHEERHASEATAPRWELTLLLPHAAFPSVLDQTRAAIEEHRFRLLVLEAHRVWPETETYLRWARAAYIALRVAFQARPTLGASVGATQLCARLLDLAVAAGGSFMPEALPHASRAQAQAGFPMLGGFLAEKQRLDPDGRLLAPWYRAVHRAWRDEACRLRWTPA